MIAQGEIDLTIELVILIIYYLYIIFNKNKCKDHIIFSIIPWSHLIQNVIRSRCRGTIYSMHSIVFRCTCGEFDTSEVFAEES